MVISLVARGMILGLSVVAGGCCFQTRYEGFRPRSVAPVIKFVESYAAARLRLGAGDVWIQVQNYPDNDVQRVSTEGFWRPTVRPEPASTMRLFLEVTPREGEIEIDPQNIRIRLADGSEVSPRGVWGPGVGRPDNAFGPGPIWLSCGRPEGVAQSALEKNLRARWNLEYETCFNCPGAPPSAMSEFGGALRTETPSCLVLLFETGNAPQGGLTLVIDNLRSADRVLDVPEVHFEKGWLAAKPCV